MPKLGPQPVWTDHTTRPIHPHLLSKESILKQLPGHMADYRPVKQRIHEMRKDHPDWTISTTVTEADGHWIARAAILDTDHLIASAGAYEQALKAFDYEKAETSAVGRALTFAGYTDSVELSQEELERSNVVTMQSAPATPPPVEKKPSTEQQTVTDLLYIKPVDSATKPKWSAWLTDLAKATIATGEIEKTTWKILSSGKTIAEMSKDELQATAAKARQELEAG